MRVDGDGARRHRPGPAGPRGRRSDGHADGRPGAWPTSRSTCASSATRRGAPTARWPTSAGAMLVVSQFTLYGDTRKGRRPSFLDAAAPDLAAELVEVFADAVEARGIAVGRGRVRGRDGGRARQRRPHDHLARQRRLSVAGSPLLGRIRNRVERLRQHRWRMAAHRSPERHIVMGGAPRSGTTLLRKLLDRHPQICCRRRDEALRAGRLQPRLAGRGLRHPARRARGACAGRRASQAAFIDAFAARVTSRWPARRAGPRRRPRTSATSTGSSSASRGLGRPRHPRRPGRRLLDARASRLALGGRRLAEGARAAARWTGTPSAGWRTRRRAWPGAATRATSRSATRTSWPTRRSALRAICEAIGVASRCRPGWRWSAGASVPRAGTAAGR